MHNRALFLVLGLALAGGGACAGGGEGDDSTAGSAGASGNGGSAGSGGTSGSGGASGGSAGSGGTAGTSGSGGSAGSAGGSGSAGMSGTGGSAGSGGSAGIDGGAGSGGGTSDAASDVPLEAGWPTCNAQPTGAAAKTIPQIWADNPATPTAVWVSGVYVTAISGGACAAATTCQLFLQQDLTYASFDLGAKHAIKVRISNNAAQYFTALAVGDRVDVFGHAWRYNLGGANELVIQVNALLQGCAKKVGSGTPTPITGIALSDLNVTSYELTHGPLLIQVANVSGKPAQPGELFGIWPTGVGIGDAGATQIVSISPFFLPGSQFTGLVSGQTTNFKSVTGVFGQYIPNITNPPKYHVIYPRSMSELAQ